MRESVPDASGCGAGFVSLRFCLRNLSKEEENEMCSRFRLSLLAESSSVDEENTNAQLEIFIVFSFINIYYFRSWTLR